MNVLRFCFTSNNNKIPVFVTNTRVTGARIGDLSALKIHFLPNSGILLTNLLDYSYTIDFVEENFSFTLTSVYVNFVVYYTATMGIPGFGDISNLITFFPLESFMFVEHTVIHTLGNLSTVSQIELE